MSDSPLWIDLAHVAEFDDEVEASRRRCLREPAAAASRQLSSVGEADHDLVAGVEAAR